MSNNKLQLPRVAWVVPTTRCNASCRTCQHHYEKFGEDMQPEIFDKLLTQLLPSLYRINLVGLGEPLVAPQFDKILNVCLERNITIYFITNGKLLTKSRINTLVESNAEIMISLDGVSDETLSYLRPDANLQQLTEVFRTIQSCRNQHPESTFRLTTNTVVTGRTLHELPAILTFGLNHGVDVVSFADLIPHFIKSANPELAEDIPSARPEELGRSFANVMRLSNKKAVRVACPPYYHNLSRKHGRSTENRNIELSSDATFNDGEGKDSIFPQLCYMPWTHVNIHIGGEVTSCCASEDILGRLSEQNFDEIWNCDRYKNLRRLVNSNNPPWPCRQCNLHAGINAGNPSYFSMFIEKNLHLRLPVNSQSICWDECAVIESVNSTPCMSVTSGGRLQIDTRIQGFILFHIIPDSTDSIIVGKLILKNGESEYFDTSGPYVLIPIRSNNSSLLEISFDLNWLEEKEAIPRLKILDISLLEKRWHPQNAAIERLSNARQIYSDTVQWIKKDLCKWMATCSGESTRSVVFGYGDLAQVIVDEAEKFGISNLGFIDFNSTMFQNHRVMALDELSGINPDLVILPIRLRTVELHERLKRACDETKAHLLAPELIN